MLKKLLFSFLLMFLVCQLQSAQVDQSDKKAVVKAMFTAIAQNDTDTIWQLLPPEVKAQAVKRTGSEAEAIKELSLYKVTDDEGKDIQKNLRDEDFLNALAAAVSENMVCVDGKWYISIPEDEEELDLSTKELLTANILTAVTVCAPDMLWLTLSPEERIGMVEKYGSISAALAEISKGLTPVPEADKAAALKKIEDPEVIKQAVKKFEKNMVQFKGSWYLDPKLHHDSFDRSNKEQVFKSYLLAIADMDENALWQTLLPTTRLKIVSETENGDLQSAKKELRAVFEQDSGIEEFRKIKENINDPELFKAMLNIHQKNLVEINGKWYIDLEVE